MAAWAPLTRTCGRLLARFAGDSGAPAVSHIVSVGYEGRSSEELAAVLKAHGVVTLVDVRLNPVSRKPGLSKTRLSATLESEGIRYEHLRHLGNPRDNRAGFAEVDVTAAADRFRDLLTAPDGQRALQELVRLTTLGPTAVLCYEREHSRCHRRVVIEELGSYVREYEVQTV